MCKGRRLRIKGPRPHHNNPVLLNMANFRVDVLVKTIDDLQKGICMNNTKYKLPISFLKSEKSKNEQVLAKECAKRKKLEQTTESLIYLLSQASDRNTKMKAEFKLEEQGQEQTQRQIDRYSLLPPPPISWLPTFYSYFMVTYILLLFHGYLYSTPISWLPIF